jgi:hypothetical protein
MDRTLVMNIRAVIEALNNVEVKGKDNMEHLLGSINHLEKIANGEIGEFILKSENDE